MKRIAVKCYLTQEENELLSRQAKQLNMERGQLIRQRALGAAAGRLCGSAGKTPLKVYHDAVAAAYRVSNGYAPRHVVESIAAAVLCCVDQLQVDEAFDAVA